MQLSSKQLSHFEDRGYLILPPGRELVRLADQVRADLACCFPEAPFSPLGGPTGAYRDDNRIQDAWRISDSVRALALCPPVISVLEQLYGRNARAFQTLNFFRGTEQKEHADNIHFSSRPRQFMCGVWVALEDTDQSNGPLVYYPGSHKLSEVTLRDLGDEVAQLMRRRYFSRMDVHQEIYRPYYEPYISSRIEEQELQPEYGIVPKGAAIIWSANLIHGGSAQIDRRRTRWSQVTHYYFDRCLYLTPLRERLDPLLNIYLHQWRRPRWIR